MHNILSYKLTTCCKSIAIQGLRGYPLHNARLAEFPPLFINTIEGWWGAIKWWLQQSSAIFNVK